MVYTTSAREGESHPFQVSWVDPYGRPLAVENVIANLFYYVGGVKTQIGNADIPMTATDQTHRFITRVEIPEGFAGIAVEGVAFFVSFTLGSEGENQLKIQRHTLKKNLLTIFIYIIQFKNEN